MTITVLPGGGADIEEPDWVKLIPGPPEHDQGMLPEWRDVAHRHWLRVTQEMRDAGTLSGANAHQIQRLVLAYIRYDYAAAMMFKLGGAVGQAKKSKVPVLNLWQTEMRAADSDATTAEMELGLPPRRRGAVTKAPQRKKAASAADAYLGKAKA